MRYIKIIVISTCFLFSCNIKQRAYSGKYGIIYTGGKYVPYVYSLKLNNDNTFDYSYSSGWIQKISNGTWNIDSRSNKLLLCSNVDNVKSIPILVVELSDSIINSKEFIFVNPTSDSTLWSVFINGTRYPIKSDKVTISNDIKIDSFYIEGYKDFTNITPYPLQETVRSKIHYVKNAQNNVFSISFPKFVDYYIFHYETIKDSFSIKRNYIIWQKGGIKLRKLPEP